MEDDNLSSLGTRLRRAREERGLSLRELADRTRISRRHLEAIEADDYKPLPGGIFNRSFVKSFAREVGFDEQEALNLYGQTARERGETPEDFPATRQHSRVYSNADSARSPLVTALISALILAVLTLGVYAGLHYYQRRTQAGEPQAAQEGGVAPATTQPQPDGGGGVSQSDTSTGDGGAAPAAAAAGAWNIRVRSKGEEVWIRSRVDEQETTNGTLAADEVKEFTPRDRFLLQWSKGKASALEVTVNGQPVTTPADTKGKPLIELVLTKEEFQQLRQP
ncbi:MAG: RodZ domain-containing protein [Pyrinomonadaceae bacterium]